MSHYISHTPSEPRIYSIPKLSKTHLDLSDTAGIARLAQSRFAAVHERGNDAMGMFPCFASSHDNNQDGGGRRERRAQCIVEIETLVKRA